MDKIESVRNGPVLQTKKQVRAFLNLADFYLKKYPQYFCHSLILSDLTRKDQSNRVVWTESQQKPFHSSDIVFKIVGQFTKGELCDNHYAYRTHPIELSHYSLQ